METNHNMNTTHQPRLSTDDIYHALRQYEHDLSENEFTTKYLKTSRSYLCNRRNKQRDVSADVLLNLYSELSGIGATWQNMAVTDSNARTRDRWQHKAQLYTNLADQVIVKLLERARADT